MREAHDELEQKIQERTQELALNEARLNRTASIAKVGHWIWDDIENKAISCSEECARMHGVSVDEYVSLTSSVAGDDNWVHPDDLESWKQCNRHLEETLEPYDTVYRLIPHRGDTRWVREIAEAEVDENGVHVRTHGVMQDITDFKRLEKIKSEFVSSMNHELRTPLTSVVGALGLARSGQLGEVHPDVQSLLDIAYNNCTRLSELINDILDIDKIMSEGMSLVLAPVNVALLIQEAMQANENYGDPLGITFEATDLDDTITVSGDKNRLLQVLSNLMSNAAKFSAKGDTVVISMASEDGNVRVVVTDQGCGIAEEFRDSIFDRFTQADASDIRKVSGSGLGLNISKTIIEQHGGTIDFDSQIGVGSTFFFSLPVLK